MQGKGEEERKGIASAKKRKDTAAGKQFSKQPKRAAATSKKFRKT